MREQIYLALQLLEDLAIRSHDYGDKASAETAVFCHEVLSAISLDYHEEKKKEAEVIPISNFKNESLQRLISYFDKNQLQARYPNLEPSAIDTAISSLDKISIDIKKFEKDADQILTDVNDDVILELLRF